MLLMSSIISKGDNKCPNWGENAFHGTGWTTVRILWTILIVVLCAFSCWNLLEFEENIIVYECPGKELWFPTSYYFNKNHQWQEFEKCTQELGDDVTNPTAEIGMAWSWRVICVGLFAILSWLQVVMKVDIPQGNYGNRYERIFFTIFKIMLALYIHLLFTVNVKNEEALAITTTGFDVATIIVSFLFVYGILKAEFFHQPDVSCVKCSFVWFGAILIFSIVGFQVARVVTWILFTDITSVMYWANEMICVDLLLLFLFVKLDPELKYTDERTCFNTCGQCWCISSYVLWSLVFLFLIPYFFYNSFCGDFVINDHEGTCFDSLNYSLKDCNYLIPSTVLNSTNNSINKEEIINFHTKCDDNLTTYQDIQTMYLPFANFFWNVDPYYGAISRVVMFVVLHLVGLLYYVMDHHQIFLDACKLCVYRSYRKQKVLVRAQSYVNPKIHGFMETNSGLFKFWFVCATFLGNSLFWMETTQDGSAVILPFTDFILVSVWFVCILYLFACFQCGARCKFMTDVFVFLLFCGQILVPFCYFGAIFIYQLLRQGFLLNNILFMNFFFAAFDQIRLTYFKSEGPIDKEITFDKGVIELQTSNSQTDDAEKKRIPGQKNSSALSSIEISSSEGSEEHENDEEEGYTYTEDCSESSLELEVHGSSRVIRHPHGHEGTNANGKSEHLCDDRISE